MWRVYLSSSRSLGECTFLPLVLYPLLCLFVFSLSLREITKHDLSKAVYVADDNSHTVKMMTTKLSSSMRQNGREVKVLASGSNGHYPRGFEFHSW
uniref:Uncharacterized protein n=1 Tax=Otarine gammaherpesvirus 4 TaxID=2801541 RepID=A0A889IW96_9GAMA|nr:hypothetical protein [Otarine gammaherpesvirus 4]